LKTFSLCYGARKCITVFIRALPLSLSWVRYILFIPSHLVRIKSIVILAFHLRRGLPNGFFPSGFTTKFLYTFRFSPYSPHVLFTPSSLNLSRAYYWWREQITLFWHTLSLYGTLKPEVQFVISWFVSYTCKFLGLLNCFPSSSFLIIFQMRKVNTDFQKLDVFLSTGKKVARHQQIVTPKIKLFSICGSSVPPPVLSPWANRSAACPAWSPLDRGVSLWAQMFSTNSARPTIRRYSHSLGPDLYHQLFGFFKPRSSQPENCDYSLYNWVH